MLATLPGAEAQSLRALADGTLGRPGRSRRCAQPGCRRPRRRAAGRGARRASPRSSALARATGARVAWVPRRAGERGAVEAGALPDPAARRPQRRRRRGPRRRRRSAGGWTSTRPGRARPRPHRRSSPPPATGSSAACWSAASTRPTCPTRRSPRRRWPAPASSSAWRCSRPRSPSCADVVLPVAAGAGEGRQLPRLGGPASARSTPTLHGTGQLPDGRVLQALADEMDVDLRLPTARGGARRARRARHRPPARRGRRARRPRRRPAPELAAGESAVLASWRQLLDAGTAAARRAATWPAPPGRRVARIGADAAAAARRGRRRPAHRQRRDRLGHPAGADHRDARPGGLAADEVTGQRGPHRPRLRPRWRRPLSALDPPRGAR